MLPALLIPAYEPDAKTFPDFVRELHHEPYPLIIIVDDGSSKVNRGAFEAVKNLSRVRLIRHAVNLGKGQALKSGINEYLNQIDSGGIESCGLVTLDADGQHRNGDIRKVAQALAASSGSVILGCRSFAGDVPLRSRIGNGMTKSLFSLLVGHKVSDTQTGLRGIPNQYLVRLMMLRGNRYEYELEMLIDICNQHMPIIEIPIETVYLDENATSHFNPILDSARIYFVFLRFTISSILTFILDTIVFFIAFHLGAGIIFSTIMARIAGGSFSFTVNKYVVFNSKKKQILGEALKFTLLVVLLGTIAIFLISAIQRLGFGIFFSKMFAEGLLFVMSFTVQRIFVFSRNVRLHVQSQSEIERAE